MEMEEPSIARRVDGGRQAAPGDHLLLGIINAIPLHELRIPGRAPAHLQIQKREQEQRRDVAVDDSLLPRSGPGIPLIRDRRSKRRQEPPERRARLRAFQRRGQEGRCLHP